MFSPRKAEGAGLEPASPLRGPSFQDWCLTIRRNPPLCERFFLLSLYYGGLLFVSNHYVLGQTGNKTAALNPCRQAVRTRSRLLSQSRIRDLQIGTTPPFQTRERASLLSRMTLVGQCGPEGNRTRDLRFVPIVPVDPTRFELVTSSLQMRRSTN